MYYEKQKKEVRNYTEIRWKCIHKGNSITVSDIDYGSLNENLSEVYDCCKKAI